MFLCDFFMTQIRIKIIGDTRFELVEVNIEKKSIAAGLDTGKLYGE